MFFEVLLPTAVPIRFEVLNRLMRFFEVLVSKASAILFPVLRLVGDSGRYNIILKVTQCPPAATWNQPMTPQKPFRF